MSLGPNSIPEDRLSDFTRDRRMLVLSLMALAIGVVSALLAYLLVQLISLTTNLAFFHRISTAAVSPAESVRTPWMILVPVLGGLVIGLMARFGSEKIRG